METSFKILQDQERTADIGLDVKQEIVIKEEPWSCELYEYVKQEPPKVLDENNNSAPLSQGQSLKSETLYHNKFSNELTHKWTQESVLENNNESHPCLWCPLIFSGWFDREDHMKLCHQEEYFIFFSEIQENGDVWKYSELYEDDTAVSQQAASSGACINAGATSSSPAELLKMPNLSCL